MSTAEAFQKFIRENLEGKTISKVAVNFNIYSLVLLEFVDEHQNVYSLFVYSSWRIIHEQKVVHASNYLDEATAGTANKFFNKKLENNQVLRVEINEHFDIQLNFQNDLAFHVFSDKDLYHSISKNWVFGINRTYWGVNNLLSIYKEENGIKRRAGPDDFCL